MNPVVRNNWWIRPPQGGSVPSLPVNTVAPVISVQGGGYQEHGATIESTTGTWSGSPTFAYQWFLNGNPIDGETEETFEIPDTFVEGDELSLVVTGTNAEGFSSANSNTLMMAAPSELSAPVIHAPGGTDAPGDVVSIQTAATFSNGATITNQWHQVGGVVITGETGTSYVLEDSDFNKSVFVRSTGTNSYGFNNSDSNSISVDYLPVNTQSPVISGWVDGPPLQVTTPAEWDFETSVSGQWRKNGSDVPGQTGITYAGSVEFGDTFIYRSTATNSIGSVHQDSNTITADEFQLNDEVTGTLIISGIAGDLVHADLADEVGGILVISGIAGDTVPNDLADEVGGILTIQGNYADP